MRNRKCLYWNNFLIKSNTKLPSELTDVELKVIYLKIFDLIIQ
jgi:hypothetical protein